VGGESVRRSTRTMSYVDAIESSIWWSNGYDFIIVINLLHNGADIAAHSSLFTDQQLLPWIPMVYVYSSLTGVQLYHS